MAGSSHQWLTSFTALTQTSDVRNLNLARALRRGGLYTKPGRGNAHSLTTVTPYHLANFLMALASDQASDTVDDVTRLRAMPFRGYEPPAFHKGAFGDVLDLMVGGKSKASKAINVLLPNEIRLSTNPYRAILVWHKATGEVDKVNSYTETTNSRPAGSNFFFKETFIHSKVIELARQALAMPETQNAALAGATLR